MAIAGGQYVQEDGSAFRDLDREQLENMLAQSRFNRIDLRARTASTNEDAQRILHDPYAGGTTIVAEAQTAGVGRNGRTWIATPGSSLLFTTILPRAIRTDALWAVPFWTALAVADGIAESTGIACEMKWPNDLLVAGRKVAGILCVSRVTGDFARVACGVGLNVHRPADAGLDGIVPPPIFLSERGIAIDRTTLLATILMRFDGLLSYLDDPMRIARLWEAFAQLHGTFYRVQVDGEPEPVYGTATHLGPLGELVLNVASGERAIALGEAHVLMRSMREEPIP
jgi:BirA family biotin operon repressor/biotin-[acetyl-CoA-carboxylase] ligase